jgi:hypothetical protein
MDNSFEDSWLQMTTDMMNLTAKLPENSSLTENGALAYESTLDSCLDMFATLVRDTSAKDAINKFIKAWNEDPETAFKILLHLRDARNGKGEKRLSYILFFYLSLVKSDLYNRYLLDFIELGYYKDLLRLAELRKKYYDKTKSDSEPKYIDMIELNLLMNQLLKDEAIHMSSCMKCYDSNSNCEISGNKNESVSLSLAAKWAPTEHCYYDKSELKFVNYLVKHMPQDRRSKKDYRLLVNKLRHHLKIIENLMAVKNYDQIVFEHIPSKAHQKLKSALKRSTNANGIETEDRKQLSERYLKYLNDVKEGKAKIKATSIEPHTIVSYYLHHNNIDDTLEVQWKQLINDLKSHGRFNKAQAICDVSGSMSGEPLNVSIALGLVISQLTEAPFNNKIITFSAKPKFHNITGTTLYDQVNNLKRADWEMNTNLLAVFELLLDAANFHNVPNENMINKLFIFTDMQFDSAVSGEWNTTYNIIQQLYNNAGYTVPKIIFWNLRATHNSFPVTCNQKGVACVSGFSSELIKLFMNEENFTPASIMKDALKNYKCDFTADDSLPINMVGNIDAYIDVTKCLIPIKKKKTINNNVVKVNNNAIKINLSVLS